MPTATVRPDPNAPYARAEIIVRGLPAPPPSPSFQLRRSNVDYVEPNLDTTGWTRSEITLLPLDAWWAADDASLHLLVSGLLCQHIEPGPLKLRLPGSGAGEIDLFWSEDITVYDDGTLADHARLKAEQVRVVGQPPEAQTRAAAEAAAREAATREAATREAAAREAAERETAAREAAARETAAREAAVREAARASERQHPAPPPGRTEEDQQAAARREAIARSEQREREAAERARAAAAVGLASQLPTPRLRKSRWEAIAVIILVLAGLSGALAAFVNVGRDTRPADRRADAFDPTPARPTPPQPTPTAPDRIANAPTMGAAMQAVVSDLSLDSLLGNFDPNLFALPASAIIARVNDPGTLLRYAAEKLDRRDPAAADRLFEEATKPRFGPNRNQSFAPAFVARGLLYDPAIQHDLPNPPPNADFAEDLYRRALPLGDKPAATKATALLQRLQTWRTHHH